MTKRCEPGKVNFYQNTVRDGSGHFSRRFRDHTTITFRKGFVQSAVFTGQDYLEWGTHLKEYCPLLEKLELLGLRGCGQSIADLGLIGLRSLLLSDWPDPADAELIARSSLLARLDVLSFWIGNVNDEVVCHLIEDSRAFQLDQSNRADPSRRWSECWRSSCRT